MLLIVVQGVATQLGVLCQASPVSTSKLCEFSDQKAVTVLFMFLTKACLIKLPRRLAASLRVPLAMLMLEVCAVKRRHSDCKSPKEQLC